MKSSGKTSGSNTRYAPGFHCTVTPPRSVPVPERWIALDQFCLRSVAARAEFETVPYPCCVAIWTSGTVAAAGLNSFSLSGPWNGRSPKGLDSLDQEVHTRSGREPEYRSPRRPSSATPLATGSCRKAHLRQVFSKEVILCIAGFEKKRGIRRHRSLGGALAASLRNFTLAYCTQG
jgi:hypothetical protein